MLDIDVNRLNMAGMTALHQVFILYIILYSKPIQEGGGCLIAPPHEDPIG